MTEDGKRKRAFFLISAAIVIATIIAYEPIRHNGFVDYDDNFYITENPDITSGMSVNAIGNAFAKPHFYMWHPLTTISHILDCQFFGLSPLGHHIVSLLIHIANAILLFWILTQITGATWASAFIAAVFALHPLQVQPVAWAAERKTVLSGFFWLLTIAVYAWYAKRPGIRRYIMLFAVYALCIMTKPVVVTLPIILLLLDYWPLGRKQWKRLLVEKIPLLGLSAVLCILTFIMQQQGGSVKTLERMPFDFRVANTFISYIRYIGKLIWPADLAVFYPLPYSNFPIETAVICAILFVLVTILCLWIGLGKKYILTGWLWYCISLVPVIGLVQSGDQALADRYMYLPMLGLLFIIVWTIKDFAAGNFIFKSIIIVSAIAALFIAVFLTRTQVSYWQDTKTLFGHALKVTENNAIMENNYGCIVFNEHKYNEAEEYFRRTVTIWPSYAVARYNLGKSLLFEGKTAEAIDCFNKVLNADIDRQELHYNLAFALSKEKKYDEAINHLREVLRLNPDYSDARERIGGLLLATGKTEEGIRYFNEALAKSTNKGDIYADLARAYNRLGNKGLEIENWKKAMQEKPDNANILNSLAWSLATNEDVNVPDAGNAVKYALRACELTNYKNPAFIDTLAAAYANAGKFEEAIKTANQAIDTARASGQEILIDKIQERIKLYQSNQRYIQK